MPSVLSYQTLSNNARQASKESQTHVMRLTELKTSCCSQKPTHMLCRTASFSRCLMSMAMVSSPTQSTFYWSPFCLSQLRWALLTAYILDQQQFAFCCTDYLLLITSLSIPVQVSNADCMHPWPAALCLLQYWVPSVVYLFVYPSWGKQCWLHASLTSSNLPSENCLCCQMLCSCSCLCAFRMAHTVVQLHAKQYRVAHGCWQDDTKCWFGNTCSISISLWFAIHILTETKHLNGCKSSFGKPSCVWLPCNVT